MKRKERLYEAVFTFLTRGCLEIVPGNRLKPFLKFRASCIQEAADLPFSARGDSTRCLGHQSVDTGWGGVLVLLSFCPFVLLSS